jgi:hypothetical protein
MTLIRNGSLASTLLDIFHATAQSSLRLAPMDINNRFVASVAALRESKMSGSVPCVKKQP